MKCMQVKIRLLFLVVVAIPMCCIAQGAREYQETKLTGSIEPIHNLRYVDSVAVIYRNHKVYLSGGGVRVTVPVQNNRFSMWVPPLPAGDDIRVILIYGNIPDSANKIIDVAGVAMMIGDSLLTISFGKGDYDANLKKYRLETNIITGEQNKMRLAYMAAISAPYRAMDTLRNKLYEKRIDSAFYKTEMQKARQWKNSLDKQFISSHPAALESLNVLNDMVQQELRKDWNAIDDASLKEYENLFNSLDKPLQEKEKGRHLIAGLQRAREKEVIPFSGTMPDGKQFDLASLKGKIFLIDFWGSWCGWCRKGHPHLKELYAKYKDKGFEIIGVSEEFGTGKQQWERFKKAIADDGLPWPQILNDPSRQDIVSLYMVRSWPSKFLVDRDGRIILRVGSDNERLLDARLKELFGE